MRHHAITELGESGASDQTIMAIAGHVSRKMSEHYSHIRLEAKREALNALSGRPSGKGTGGGQADSHVTNHVTRTPSEAFPSPQLINKCGGADETRTRDLLRDRQAF